MASESDSGQEKTEQPTAKKLRDAKQKGQVPRSKELNSMTIMVFGALGLMFMGSHMIEHISIFMQQGFSITRGEVFSDDALMNNFSIAIFEALTAIGPFMFLMTVIAIFRRGGMTSPFECSG